MADPPEWALHPTEEPLVGHRAEVGAEEWERWLREAWPEIEAAEKEPDPHSVAFWWCYG